MRIRSGRLNVPKCNSARFLGRDVADFARFELVAAERAVLRAGHHDHLLLAVSERFLTPQNISVILQQVAVVGIIAVPGAMLVLAGYVDLSVGSIAVFAATIFGKSMEAGLGLPLALLLGFCAGTGWGVLNGWLITLLLLAVIVTLGGLAGARGLSELITLGFAVFGFGPEFAWLGNGAILSVPVPVWIFVLIFVIGAHIWYQTPWGRHMVAIGGAREAAKALGINVRAIPFPDYRRYSSGDDDPVRMGCCPRAGVDQTFGQGIELVAAVEAPGEAGQVALGVLGADVMVGAGECRLDVAERGVDPGKGDPLGRVRPRAGDHGEVVAAGFTDRRPAGQAVGHDVAAGGEVALGQRRDLLLAEALDHRQPQPARLALGRSLDRRHERRLAGRTAAALAASALPAEIGVVHLHPPRQLGLLRLARRHRRHQLVLDQPGGRLPCAEPPRQLDRAHPALALREVVDRQEPDGQRQFGPVEHGARGQPDLALAAVALVDRPALQFGIAGMAAARARPAFAPAQRKQRRPALRLGPEPLPELALAQTLDPPRRTPLSAPIRSLRHARNPRGC